MLETAATAPGVQRLFPGTGVAKARPAHKEAAGEAIRLNLPFQEEQGKPTG